MEQHVVTVQDGEFHFASLGEQGSGGIAILQGLPAHPIQKTPTPRKVLVVEDNLDSLHSLVLLLRDIGHKVEFAINGYAALHVAEQFQPEVVLLDLGLPGMHGIDVCSRLRANPSLASARIIAITAYANDD